MGSNDMKFVIFFCSSGKKGAPPEYYTLECLLYLLKNVQLQHSVYVRQCAVSVVILSQLVITIKIVARNHQFKKICLTFLGRRYSSG